MKATIIACATIAVCAISTTSYAQDVVIDIDNGLYAFSDGLNVSGQTMLENDFEYCLTDKHTKKTLSDLISELADGGTCDVTNVQVGSNSGSADMSCYIEEFGAQSTGKVEADYSRTHYNVNATGRIGGGPEFRSFVKARRIGECPEGWTPPPGISDE